MFLISTVRELFTQQAFNKHELINLSQIPNNDFHSSRVQSSDVDILLG